MRRMTEKVATEYATQIDSLNDNGKVALRFYVRKIYGAEGTTKVDQKTKK